VIRRVSHNLKFATSAKKQRLDAFFSEYARLVNSFIQLYWNSKNFPGKANSEIYTQIDSWMMGKARKCAANQAIKILKSVRKKIEIRHTKPIRKPIQERRRRERTYL